MITSTQENNIKLLLSAENSKEIIQAIIKEYTKESVSNCQFLLSLVSNIVNRFIHTLEKKEWKSLKLFLC